MGTKIAVVGGGSTYTPELVDGFARRASRLPIDELVLLDIDADRLAVVGGLAQRMLDYGDWPGRLTLTGDPDAAIDGADFVLIQLRVGGQAARLVDETLPLDFGVIGQETTGAGGFAKALRTVPMVLDLAERTARRAAPGAWIVDFTNPVGIVTQALIDDGHRAVGLCNVAITLQRRMAARFGVEPDRVALEHVGLNHLTWERAVRVDGVDRLPELLATGRDELADELNLPAGLIEWVGAIPSYYLRYYYLTRTVLEEQRAGHTRASDVMDIEARLLELYRDPALAEKPKLLEERGGAFYSEAAAQLIASLHDGAGDLQVVDVRNDGAHPGPARPRRGGGAGHRRSRRGPSDPPGAARARAAWARPGRQGVRGTDRRRRHAPVTGRPPCAPWRPTRSWAPRSPNHCSQPSSRPTRRTCRGSVRPTSSRSRWAASTTVRAASDMFPIDDADRRSIPSVLPAAIGCAHHPRRDCSSGRTQITRRPRRSRRLVLLLSAVVLATLSPAVPPVAGAEETGPAKPVKLPVQQGEENSLDLVRRQTPADIDITEPGGGAVPDPGTKRVTPPRDVAPDAKTDVATQRAEHSSITANPDGTYTATITGDRQNYQDTSGKWQPIDTSLVADATDGFTLRSKANDRVVRIDEQPSDGVVATIELGSRLVRLISPAAKAGTLDKAVNAVDFSTAAGDGLVVAPTPEGLDYRFRLIGPTSPRALEVTIDTDGLLATADKDGRTILLVDDRGEIAASITAPIAYDAAGTVAADPLTTVEDPHGRPGAGRARRVADTCFDDRTGTEPDGRAHRESDRGSRVKRRARCVTVGDGVGGAERCDRISGTHRGGRGGGRILIARHSVATS